MDVVTLALAKKYADAHSGSAGSAHVFETKAEMEEWVAANSDKLEIGDSLYIIQKDVPDFWWDGNQLQELETKIDFSPITNKIKTLSHNPNYVYFKVQTEGWRPHAPSVHFWNEEDSAWDWEDSPEMELYDEEKLIYRYPIPFGYNKLKFFNRHITDGGVYAQTSNLIIPPEIIAEVPIYIQNDFLGADGIWGDYKNEIINILLQEDVGCGDKTYFKNCSFYFKIDNKKYVFNRLGYMHNDGDSLGSRLFYYIVSIPLDTDFSKYFFLEIFSYPLQETRILEENTPFALDYLCYNIPVISLTSGDEFFPNTDYYYPFDACKDKYLLQDLMRSKNFYELNNIFVEKKIKSDSLKTQSPYQLPSNSALITIGENFGTPVIFNTYEEALNQTFSIAGVPITIDSNGTVYYEYGPNGVKITYFMPGNFSVSIEDALAIKQDKLRAGEGISISDDGVVKLNNVSIQKVGQITDYIKPGSYQLPRDSKNIIIGGNYSYPSTVFNIYEDALNQTVYLGSMASPITINNEGLISFPGGVSAVKITYFATKEFSVSIEDALKEKQNKLTAGEGISISEEGVVSLNLENANEVSF